LRRAHDLARDDPERPHDPDLPRGIDLASRRLEVVVRRSGLAELDDERTARPERSHVEVLAPMPWEGRRAPRREALLERAAQELLDAALDLAALPVAAPDSPCPQQAWQWQRVWGRSRTSFV